MSEQKVACEAHSQKHYKSQQGFFFSFLANSHYKYINHTLILILIGSGELHVC